MSALSPRRARTILTGIYLLGVLLLVGCGSGYPTTVAVTGVVTYKGNPVEGANVIFARGERSTAKGELAIGKTDASGRFELTTHFAGKASSVGAVPGEYEVTISKHVPPPGMTMARYQAMVEAANKIGETGATVPDDKQPPQLVEMLPAQYSVSGKSKLTATVNPSGGNDLKFPLD